MTKSKLNKLIAYVHKSMDDASHGSARTNNISISLGHLSDKDFLFLRKYFKSVTPCGFWGYVNFVREEEPR